MQILDIKYPAIHAKLNGMYAKKVKKDQLEEIIKQNTTRQAVALLKSFSKDFKELEDDPRRTNIRMVLDHILIKDIEKINRLLNKKDRKVFQQFLSIYEIKCIKSTLRRFLSNSNMHGQITETVNWTSSIFKSLDDLVNVKTYDEFLEILQKTKYESIFADYSDINEISVFKIENRLDQCYFENIMKVAKSYSATLVDMIGKQIDLNNIIWIYRIKKYYHFTEEELEKILIPIYYQLKKADMKKLIQVEQEQELSKLLQMTYYAKYIHFGELTDLEEKIDQYLYRLYKKYFKGNILDSSSIYAYIGMLERENNDIMNVMEGIRYQLDKEEIKKKLV